MSSSSQKTASPLISRTNSISDEGSPERGTSANKKSARKSESNSANRMSRSKAKTQMLPQKTSGKELQTAPTNASAVQEQNPDEQPPNEEEKVKSIKKQPKISLRRQMTQKRMSQIAGIQTSKPVPRKSMSISVDSPLTIKSDNTNNNGRNSLSQIKDQANNQTGRQSVMVTQIKTGNQGSQINLKQKSLGGGATIEELSERESDEESSRYNRNETIHEDDDEEDDPFKAYANDDSFKKVIDIADKITQPNPSEADQTEIVNYLKQLPMLIGRFEHLNKSLTKKLIDCFEVRFTQRGEYIFRKGDKPDYAYVILYGSVICLNVKSTTYLLGQEPQSPVQEVKKKESLAVNTQNMNPEALKKYQEEQKDKEIMANMRRKIYKENFVTIEEETKVVEFGVGIMIGEVAMMSQNAVRALSGMAKTDCVFLLLNREAFDVLVKKYLKGKEIIKEGQKCDRLYIIKEGLCAMFKQIEIKDMLGMPKIKQEKIMNIETGGIFGEESLIFDNESTYTIKAITPLTILYITYNDLKREFKRLIPSLAEFCQKRGNFILERYQKIKNARNYERKHFNSRIEKGSMNVFLQRDFKNQIDFADNRTKRKLQVFFLRKELQQLQDAKQRLNEEMEREKQELSNFHTAAQIQHNTSRFVPQMVETPQIQYVNKVLFPQRVKQIDQNGAGGSLRQLKQTMNVDLNKRQSMILVPKLLNSQSTSNLITPVKQILGQSMIGPIQPNSPSLLPIQNQQYQHYALKNKRTLSQFHGSHTNSQQNLFKTNDNRNQYSQSQMIHVNGNTQGAGGLGSMGDLIKITNAIVDTDEDGPIQTYNKGLSNGVQNRPPMRIRAVSTLSGPIKTNSQQAPNTIITPSTSISIQGSNIKTEAAKQHFFDKRNIAGSTQKQINSDPYQQQQQQN